MIRIAIDAMGGDSAPEAPVRGTIAAAEAFSDVALILVGDEQKIAAVAGKLPANVSVVHTTEVIATDEEPVRAVRRKKEASLVKACALVRDGEADVAISAGNTGALMAAGLFVVGRIRGIERPALAPLFPTMDGRGTLVLDVGANADAKAEHLRQYALMGDIYAKKVRDIAKPRIGLLNIGTEAAKGNELTKSVYPLLQEMPFHFVGNVEARDVLNGACDVLVCDGFSGNILLKSIEGAAAAILTALKQEMTRTLPNKLAAAVLKPSLRRFKDQLDYAEYGGAPLLGLKGAVVKSHGSSDEKAMKNAVVQAKKYVEHQVIAQISEDLKGSERS